VERERKIKRAKEREKKRGETGGEDEKRLEQAILTCSLKYLKMKNEVRFVTRSHKKQILEYII